MTDIDRKPKLIKPMAGYLPTQLHAVDPHPVRTGDRPLPNAAERPCARCGRMFPPSLKRRLLCLGCFKNASGGDEAA